MIESGHRLRLDVLDDEPEICSYASSVASSLGFITHTPESPLSFMKSYTADKDVVVLDLYMPEIDGVELLRFMASNTPPKYIILISGGDEVVLKSAQKLAEELGLNVVDVLRKPIRKQTLEESLLRVARVGSGVAPAKVEHDAPTLSELNAAILNNEFDVVFQPQVRCTDQKLMGFEALARWNSPKHGEVAPLDFIPMAEKAGLVSRLDRRIMQRAISWMSLFKGYNEGLKLSINMSAHTFNDLSLPEHVLRELDEYGMKPDCLSIEVTETAIMRDLGKSLDILTRLRMKGVHLSIDDFGTGYSSMLQLVRIPFSELKIDGSFVEGAKNDSECRAVVKASTSLAKELGMTVVAERVSSSEALSLVTELGCDLAQGFFTGKPMAPETVIKLLEHTSSPH